MAKIDLNTVSSGYLSQAALNANFTAIEDEFQNKVLYRDNPSGEPNSMQTHLDMNGYHVLNAGNPSLMDADNIAYTPDGTGAETRTIAEKLNEVVSVKDFGAVGDGVTDDTAAFQEALSANCAIILIPSGTYFVPSPSSIAGNTSKLWLSANAYLTTTSGGIGKAFSGIFYGEIMPRNFGPIAVANDRLTEEGENAGLKVITGKFPTATPAVNDRVAITSICDNIDKTTSGGGIWGANIVALQNLFNSDGVTSATDCIVRAAEFEVNKVNGGSNPDPFSGSAPYRANGIEIVAQSGSVFQPTAAATVWANDTTGSKWWQIGAAISRVTKWGIFFLKNPGGASDTGNAFGGGSATGASIRDESDSTSVISIAGSHTNLIDLASNPTIGSFVRTKNNANSILSFRNFANYSNSIDFDSGNGVQQLAELTLSDNGVRRWGLQKLADGRFQLYSYDESKSILLINQYSSTIDFGGNNTNNIGSLSIGSTGISACATLEINSTTKGVLFPRMTTTQRDNISSAANGLVVYNSTTNKLQVYAGGSWVDLH